MLKRYKPFIIQIGIALLVGGLSAFVTRNNFNIFETITKPPLTPPGWVFPVVWGILFTLMGVSAALVYKEQGSIPFVYWLQLFVNFTWSIIFFNMQAYLFAFIWLLILWGLILAMIVEFYSISKLAGLLQIPYLLWVTFAGYLTFAIWFLNR